MAAATLRGARVSIRFACAAYDKYPGQRRQGERRVAGGALLQGPRAVQLISPGPAAYVGWYYENAVAFSVVAAGCGPPSGGFIGRFCRGVAPPSAPPCHTACDSS